jgi:type IV secretion system protein VirB2
MSVCFGRTEREKGLKEKKVYLIERKGLEDKEMNTYSAAGWRNKRFLSVMLLLLSVLLSTPCVVEAVGAVSGGGAMPWEGPLTSIASSLTGPVALAISLIMVVVGIGVLMFGGDLAGWARWVAFAALAAGTLGGALNLVNLLGVTGALI